MTLQNLLETFEPMATAATRNSSDILGAGDIERIRSQAYEAGYASGWEDAQKADDDGRQRIEAEFERNIQNLVFTYSEAVDCIRGELKGFVEALIEGFFPAITSDLVREHVRGELLKLADELVETPIEIVTSPDGEAILAEMLQGDFPLQVTLVKDPTLASRQVYIRVAEREIEINTAPLLEALRAATHSSHGRSGQDSKWRTLTRSELDALRETRFRGCADRDHNIGGYMARPLIRDLLSLDEDSVLVTRQIAGRSRGIIRGRETHRTWAVGRSRRRRVRETRRSHCRDHAASGRRLNWSQTRLPATGDRRFAICFVMGLMLAASPAGAQELTLTRSQRTAR